ncbi:MAG: type II secretion system F family protein [Candidatus Eremiobacteraeota bacterium]|nr:type II secretion system F family protein [Candidatus Eremiobacteraeota bacterium]MCW5868233.1 type II secretion system F family protein [Candidatus Eremiobacteraeota bacterium]
MPTFVYEARDATGQLRKDTIEAANLRAATQRLQEQRMTVIQIKAKAAGAGADGIAGLLSRMKKVDEQALTVFSRQFATMINAGLAMVRCLDILSEQTEDKKLRETLIQVRRDVEGGSTLSNSLAKHPTVFSMLYISMVKAGEMGGVLDEVLERLAGFMEKDFALKKKVKSALTYPVVILLMASGIVFFLVTYILPTFVALFEGMSLALPLPTQILIAVTKGARNPAVMIPLLILLCVGGFLVGQYIKTPAGRKQYDMMKLNIPVFGLLNRKVAISRFCRTLGTLLSSGVPIMQALEIVGRASGNEIIAMTVTKVRESIREGESIASPLGASGMFPPMVTQMVAVGEETGNLDAMLSKIADFYDTEVEYMLASLTSMLEPIMIVGMGGIVGFIVISVFLPLYQLIGNIGG